VVTNVHLLVRKRSPAKKMRAGFYPNTGPCLDAMQSQFYDESALKLFPDVKLPRTLEVRGSFKVAR
jgi:hypothetical protein